MKLLKRKKEKEFTGRSPSGPAGKTAPVFSYYSKRSDEATPRPRSQDQTSQSKRRPFWLLYAPSLLALIVVLAAALYVTTLTDSPKVVLVHTTNEPVAIESSTRYEEAANTIMRQSFKSRSKLTIDTDKIAADLKVAFPELDKVIVTIPLFGRRPIVQAALAKPALILVNRQGSFVIDTYGRPILKADQLASSVKDTLPVVADTSDASLELGKQLLTSDLVAFVTAIRTQFDGKKLAMDTYTFPSLANELHIKPTGKNFYIKFNTDGDARLQAGTYFAVQERLDGESKTPAEYIDVRVEERAYYK